VDGVFIKGTPLDTLKKNEHAGSHAVYVETGKTRTFAVSVDWPGWCRSGRDETSALQILFDYGPCYARAMQTVQPAFFIPAKISDLLVVERLEGNTTTDFGAPSLSIAQDSQPISPAELERFQLVLKACWDTFDSAVQASAEKTLRKGPRGGGRDLTKIVEHVRDVDIAYLSSLGGSLKIGTGGEPVRDMLAVRESILSALILAAHGELPTHGPRGGMHWTPRYFVRRLAWHELDHAWEIEDRAE
jgi:hypothetical protein